MIIPPTPAAGRSLIDLVAQTSHLWIQFLLPGGLDPAPAPLAAQPTAPLVAHADRRPAPVPPLAGADEPITTHAFLVLLVHFAQHLGLIDLLEAVPIAQKTVDHTPHSKLIAFLVGILGGISQLRELNDGPMPLVCDPVLAQAWSQPAFAHYSGVSRTLAAADADTLQAIMAVVRQVSRPFIDQEVLAILRTNQPLTVDIDLTGRPVSATSTCYPDAAFGWMDDGVAKGYQSAITSLSTGPTGRLLLTSQRYGGRTQSARCLQAAVSAMEQVLQVRPQRRTTLIQDEVTRLATAVAERETTYQALVADQQAAQQQLDTLLVNATTSAGRLARQEQRVQQLMQRRHCLEQEIWQLRQHQRERADWLAHLTAENEAMPAAVPIVLRVDAGFATDANLAWLIEMGYTIVTKVHSGQTTKRLQRMIAADADWTPVGANAEALALGPQRIGAGRYPLDTLQIRYHLPEGIRHTTLL